jgi:predicted acyltransferase
VTAARRPRFVALDLLRGVTIAAMILVNNPGNWGSVFSQLTHAAWNGLTIADLIFPTFIFIMGVALSLSMAARSDAARNARPYLRILRRGALLVAMGLALNAANVWPALETMRIPGVLQRIGLSYVGAAMIALNASDEQIWVASAVLVLLHWGLLAIPVGAFPGSLDPGHNIGVLLDRRLFGTHLLTQTGDPEGLIGLPTSIATALFGVAVGRWTLRATAAAATGDTRTAATSVPDRRSRLRSPLERLVFAGGAAVAVGCAWSLVLPFNKALWTGSFALVASGVAMLCLAVCQRLVEGRGSAVGAPFLWLGVNPLAVYFMSELVGGLVQRPLFSAAGHAVAPKDLVYWDLLVPLMRDSGGPWSSLVYAIGYALLWIGVAGLLYRRGIRIKV